MVAHSGQCQYIESDFEDDFNTDVLDTARWLPGGSVKSPPAGVAASASGKYTTKWGAQTFGGYQVCFLRIGAARRALTFARTTAPLNRTTARLRAPWAPPAPAPAPISTPTR
jgi:hypothetical protein